MGIGAEPNEKKRKRGTPETIKSQYKGVVWSKLNNKWHVLVCVGNYKTISGGYWTDELDAAKKVNQICEENGLQHKNEDIGAVPLVKKKEKGSNQSAFKCVHWFYNKWRVEVNVNSFIDKNGKRK